MDYHWLTRKCDGDCENCDPGACRTEAQAAAPERIWLQVDQESPNVDESTWCRDRINDTDVLYVRASWLRACGNFCAPDGTCACAKFADDPTKCERRKEWERAYGVKVAGDGQPCPNTHDPDCRWPECLCRTRGVEASEAPCAVCGGNERNRAGYLLCECPAASLKPAAGVMVDGGNDGRR